MESMAHMTIADLLGIGSKINKRIPGDFYPTRDRSATKALIAHEGARILQRVWEPFVGKDDIGAVLEESGREVIRTDLNDRGFGEARVDFLMERSARARAIVSNPPFCLARQIIAHAAWPLGIEYMALLLKADFLNSNKSSDSFDLWRPARVLVIPWRIDFTGQGAGPMNCNWYIWNGISVKTELEIIKKP